MQQNAVEQRGFCGRCRSPSTCRRPSPRGSHVRRRTLALRDRRRRDAGGIARRRRLATRPRELEAKRCSSSTSSTPGRRLSAERDAIRWYVGGRLEGLQLPCTTTSGPCGTRRRSCAPISRPGLAPRRRLPDAQPDASRHVELTLRAAASRSTPACWSIRSSA